jgi:IS4 transposase
MNIFNSVFAVFFTVCLIALLFLILRAVVLWYYRVNERVELQQRTNELLEKIYRQLGGKEE